METTDGPPQIAAVTVTPDSAEALPGATLSLTATVWDTTGQVVTTARPVWTSTDSAVAMVNGTGLVAAVSPGSASIRATVDGRSGTARIRVRAPIDTTTAMVRECATPQPEWIWCDDFEQDRLSRYFEYTDPTSFSRSSQIGLEGSSGMRARWGGAGQVSAGSLKLAFGRTPSGYMRPIDAGTSNYRELYWRFYLRNEPGWSGGGGHKLARITVFAGDNWSQAMIGHMWTDANSTRLKMDPASGTDAAGNLRTTTYNDFANLRWLGAQHGPTPLFDSARVGAWFCIETRVRLNDAGSANGVFEFWIDGNLEASRTDLNWLGSYSAYGLNALFLENYWNDGAPRAQERYFDNLVVSTQRIGC